MWLFFSIPVIFIVVGCIVWAAAAKPKVAEFGRLTAQAGLIGLCWSLAGHYSPLMH
jgi:hypothetical protein